MDTFKEKCAANGRKSWAMRSAADKAAQIARINTPEVSKRASDANKAKYQAMTDEERAAFVEAGQRAHRKPVEGTPVNGAGEVVRFDSAGSAAQWVLSTLGGKSFTSTRHTIYEALAGRRETAYGYLWRRP